MRILIVNNLYPPRVRGGAERSVQLLAEALARGGDQITVVTAAQRPAATAEIGGVKVVTLAAGRAWWLFGEARASRPWRKIQHLMDIYNPLVESAVRGVIRREMPEVVHTNNLQGLSVAVWRAARALRVPVVHTLRDYYLQCARAVCHRDGGNCGRTCAPCVPFSIARRFFSRTVAGVVGVSRFILQRHLDHGFFRHAVVREAVFNPVASVPARRRSIGPVVTFGYLGRIERIKGVEPLVRAFAERRDQRWRLLIAGTGQAHLVEHLKRQAERSPCGGQIQFLGWTDADDFLAQVDVLVVPSLWHEPLPRSALEAQARGVVVVGARRGGIGEVISDGVDGLLFEPEEPGSLARVVDRLLGRPDLLQSLARAGLRRAQRHGAQIIAREYREVFEQCRRAQFSAG